MCLISYILNYASDGKLLSSDVTHYMIPDWKVVQDYLEILEFPELKGIIFMQTACQAVQHQRGRRYLFCIIYLWHRLPYPALPPSPLKKVPHCRGRRGIYYFVRNYFLNQFSILFASKNAVTLFYISASTSGQKI